jgi:hypothetical protein
MRLNDQLKYQPVERRKARIAMNIQKATKLDPATATNQIIAKISIPSTYFFHGS